MSRWSDGLGRTIVIAGIAGALFAGFLALTPRITAADVAATPTTTGPTSVASSLPGISDPVVPVPTTALDVQVTVTTDPVNTTTTMASDTDPTLTTLPPDPGYDGTITLGVEARNSTDAHARGLIVEGDEIQWRFTLTNESDEELWGAYVYLELHGPAWCDAHNLQPGESTDCWIATTAVEGTWTANAWATAWTVDRIVKDRIDYTFDVTV